MDNQSSAQDEQAIMSFRHHRHDVLNMLQLVRAYIQLDRQDKAIQMIDSTALWLQSISLLAASSTEFGETLMWTAARCPHVAVIGLDDSVLITSPHANALTKLLVFLDGIASVLGWPLLQIQVISSASTNDAGDLCVTVICHSTEEQQHLEERLLAFKSDVHIKVVVK